jgi:hypothetical protein
MRERSEHEHMSMKLRSIARVSPTLGPERVEHLDAMSWSVDRMRKAKVLFPISIRHEGRRHYISRACGNLESTRLAESSYL